MEDKKILGYPINDLISEDLRRERAEYKRAHGNTDAWDKEHDLGLTMTANLRINSLKDAEEMRRAKEMEQKKNQ